MQTKAEEDYQTIEYEIARLDRQIILHLAKRLKYKELAYKLKPNQVTHSVEDFRTKLEQRKQWATSIGINPNVANKLSQYLIDYYLTEGKYSQKQI
ncbi:MAG: isochorismate-pyruvate lyase [Cyanobacteria bacterium J06600_6]